MPAKILAAKILVVDDHRFLRHFLCSLLAGQSDWDVYEAENGKVALDPGFVQSGRSPDLGVITNARGEDKTWQ